MSDKYKEQLDKIVVSDALKERILSAAEEKIEKKASKSKNSKVYYFRIAAGVAACAAAIFISAVTVDFGTSNAPSGDKPHNILAQLPDAKSEEKSDEKTTNSPNNTDNDLNVPAPSPEEYNIENRISSNSADNAREPKKIEALTPDDNIPGGAGAPSDDEIPSLLAPAPGISSATAEEIEREAGYKINTPQYLPEGYSVKDASLMFGSLVQIVYSNESDEITYRTEKTQGNISGDYNIYEKTEIIDLNGAQATFCGNSEKFYLAYWNTDEAYSISTSEGMALEELIKIAESVG